MEKVEVFRKPARRRIRVFRDPEARKAIGRIERNTDTYILTFGQFSLIDALVAIVDQVGPATVDVGTWTAADADLRRSAELVEAAAITRCRWVIDYSFELREPGFVFHMRQLFGPECIRAIRTHAKFLVIRSPSADVVVRTSMNLNQNSRLENLEISEDREFAEFYTRIVDEIFDEVAEGERRSRTVDLPGVPDTFPFREIEAPQIKRESLNEIEVTHTVKRL